MKMKAAVLCALSLSLAGCASDRAEMYAAKGSPKGGIVRYAGVGGDLASQQSRESAQKLMDSYCSGAHHVVTEGPYRVLDAGAKMVPAGENGFTVQNSEESYWMIVFDCRGTSADAARPAPEAAPVPKEAARAPVILDFAALRSLPAPEVYRQLASADAAQASRYLEKALPSQKEDLTAYIAKNKGSASAFSWQFRLAPGLGADEKRFVSWYLQNYTDYKPAY